MVAEKDATRMPASWNLSARLASLARRGLGPATVMDVLARLRGSKLGLRTHLVLFALAIVLPVQIYSAFLLHRYAQAERAQNEQRVLQIARALSADIDREIRAIVTTLEALVISSALAAKDFKSFHQQAKEALKSRPWNVLVIDPNRRQLVNTRLPWGTPLPVGEAAEPDLVRIARETGRPHVSDLFMGTVAAMREPEAVGAEHDAVLQHDAAADADTLADGGLGVDDAVFADLDVAPDRHVGMDDGTGSDPGTLADRGERTD